MGVTLGLQRCMSILTRHFKHFVQYSSYTKGWDGDGAIEFNGC